MCDVPFDLKDFAAPGAKLGFFGPIVRHQIACFALRWCCVAAIRMLSL